MPMTPLPPSPSRADPTNFAVRGDALLSAFPTFVTQANALEVNVDAKEIAVNANAISAAANAALAAANATAVLWVSGTTYAIADIRRSPANAAPYRRLTTGAGVTDPSADATNWAVFSVAQATNAATVTNGVYTVGAQTIVGVKTFSAQDRHSVGVGVDMNFHLNLNGGNVGLGWGITETGADGALRFETRTDLGAYTTRMSVDTASNLTVSGNVTAFSDIRLKTDITKITDALAKVNQLNGYTYTRIDTGERQTGVIAQELQKVLPEAVMNDGETLSVAYGNMMGLMIEAVKELTARIKVLEAR